MNGDPIRIKILDNLLDVTGIDPAFINPDDQLKKDLAMSAEQVARFLNRLELPVQKNDPNLRQIEDLVRSLSGKKAA